MRRYKKIIVVLMFMLISFNLTGCDIMTNLKSKATVDDISTQISNASQYPMTKDTYDLFSKAQDKLVDFETMQQSVDSGVGGWFQGIRLDYKKKQLIKSWGAAQKALNKDETYQNALNLNGNNDMQSEEGGFTGFIKKWLIVILVVLIAIVGIIFGVKALKKPRQPKVKPQKPTPTVPATVEKVNVREGMGNVAVNYERMLKDECSKIGANYSEVLAQHNNDVEAAYYDVHKQFLQQKYNR